MVNLGTLFMFIRNGMNIRQDKSQVGLPITRIETISDATIDPNRVGYAGLRETDCGDWLLEPGDILFSHINSVEHIGKCAVYEGAPAQLVHGMNLLCLRPDRDVLEPGFAKWLLRSNAFRTRLSNFINKAVNQASVSIGNLKTIEVLVPPLPEQRRIADILDRAEDLRAKRRAALAQLDTLTQAIFLEMFGDPVVNPKSLSKRPLGDLIRLKSGQSLLVTDLATNGNVPVYGGNGINGYHDKFMLEEPAVVVGRVGVYCGVVHRTRGKSWITDNALYVAEMSPQLTQVYLTTALSVANLNQYAGRAAQPLVSGSRIYPVEILVPPVEQQNEFGARVKAVENCRELQMSSQNELESLFASLQHRAFRGEL